MKKKIICFANFIGYFGFSFSLQLCDLYENDSIFDKFECCQSGDGSRVATGSYRCFYTLYL